jgi:hypothetical protein
LPAIMPNESQPGDFAQRNHRKQSAINAYPQLWRRMIRDWQSDQQEDALWMLYAASYLARTAGVRWALDPFALFTRAGGVSTLDYRADLVPLDLILLSHRHADHFDPHLLTELCASPLTWIVPEFMLEMVTTFLPLDADRVIIARVDQPIQFKTMTITPFKALHIRGKSGVPELGYLWNTLANAGYFPVIHAIMISPCYLISGRWMGCLRIYGWERVLLWTPTPPFWKIFVAFLLLLMHRLLSLPTCMSMDGMKEICGRWSISERSRSEWKNWHLGWR